MTDDADWGEIDSLPASKPGIPRWLWCCGCGCLLPIVLAIVLSVWGWRIVQEGGDPVKAREQLESTFELDELPEGWTLVFGKEFGWPASGVEFYLFAPAKPAEGEEREENPLAAMLFVTPVGFDVQGGTAGGAAAEAEPFKITIQGRELDGERTSQENASAPFPFLPAPQDGATASIDLGTEGEGEDAREHILVLVRQGSAEPITDDEIRGFLAPFHIGPEREPEVPAPPAGEEGADDTGDGR